MLDLERLAAHKGSVLGNLPDEVQPSQKMFDSRIWLDFSRFNAALPLYVEAESRKVGLLRVPEVLIAAMHQGICYEAVTPAPLRAKLLREEYAHLIANCDLLFFKLDCIKSLHSAERITEWKTLFSNYQGAQSASPLTVSDISAAGFADVARHLLA